jgi:hypothetical protein
MSKATNPAEERDPKEELKDRLDELAALIEHEESKAEDCDALWVYKRVYANLKAELEDEQ